MLDILSEGFVENTTKKNSGENISRTNIINARERSTTFIQEYSIVYFYFAQAEHLSRMQNAMELPAILLKPIRPPLAVCSSRGHYSEYLVSKHGESMQNGGHLQKQIFFSKQELVKIK